MLKPVLALMALAVLAACAGGGQQGPLPTEQLEAVKYVPEGPPKLTLVSVISNRTGRGGHTALLVTASQQVLFDPAGSFRHETITEYGDVLYGMTPAFFRAFQSAHARNSHHIVTQEIPVTAQTAEQALALVQAQGTVASAFCANSTSHILQSLPGFENIDVTFYPEKLRDQVATIPGVVTNQYFENDEGNVVDGIAGLNL